MMTKKESGIPRRQFIQGCGIAFLAAFAASQGVHIVQESETVNVPRYPNPGWAQPNQSLFIDAANDGHKKFLLDSVWQHIPLQRQMRRELRRRYTYNEVTGSQKLGDVFSRIIYSTRSLLSDEYKGEPSWDAVVEAAVYPFALLHSGFMPFKMKTSLVGKIFPDNPEAMRQLELTALRSAPKIFPVTPLPDASMVDVNARFKGYDRTQHFAQHVFLTHAYSRGKIYNLSYIEKMPFFLSVALWKERTIERKAHRLSRIVGTGWEDVESIRKPLVGTALGLNEGVPSGFWDRLVGLDLQANHLGALVGVFLGKPGLTENHIQHVVRVLNDEKISQPIPDSLVPYVDMRHFDTLLT